MEKIKNLKLFGLIFFVFVLISTIYIFFHRIFLPHHENVPVKIPVEKIDIAIKNVHYIETDKNFVKKWEIWADNANYNKERNLSNFFNVKLLFFSGKEPSFTLTGDKGILNTRTRNIELAGNIKCTIRKGFSFTTNSLLYNAENHEISTRDRVTLNTGRMVIKGKIMSYDLTKKKLKLKKEINAKTSG
ncbi:MAG: LPS export ABC transporter periplasmic protein LptC [Thermodesulfobacteriota bacterium]|nr:LPS export ABC transporter periplasmic protein LptC [Thermodesulfobacteriota bacterium]